jgi:hypothetical protein
MYSVVFHVVAAQVDIDSKIEATLKAIYPYFSFKRLVPSAFNVGLIGSTCTALPGAVPPEQVPRQHMQEGHIVIAGGGPKTDHAVAAQVEVESKV